MRKKKVLMAVMAAVVAFCVVMMSGATAKAEDETEGDRTGAAWILRRQSTDNVLIQKEPGKQPYEYWRFVDNDPPCGAEIRLTGEKSGQWLECVCVYLEGQPTGWVRSGFVEYDEPSPCGMIATVTRRTVITESIGGRAAWECVAGDRVKVLFRSGEYCTTIWGFIRADALDFAVTGEVTQPRRAWPDWTRKDHLINVIDWGL